MQKPIPYEFRTINDRVPPEGFPRIQLDRSFKVIGDMFRNALGLEMNPLQVSLEKIRATGSLSLLDVGCGTGNTLRTWKERLVSAGSCDPGQITAEGISLYDYRKESMHLETEQACTDGTVIYTKGDALKTLRKRPKDSVDVALSFHGLAHLDRQAESVLEQMVRVMRSGATAFFNIHEKQNTTSHPVFEYICWLDDQGYSSHIQPYSQPMSNGKYAPYTLCWLRKPETLES